MLPWACVEQGETFRTKLKAARKRRGLSQQALADLLDLDKQSIKDWEAGRRRPRLVRLDKIAEALEMPKEWFFEEGEASTATPVAEGKPPPRPRKARAPAEPRAGPSGEELATIVAQAVAAAMVPAVERIAEVLGAQHRQALEALAAEHRAGLDRLSADLRKESQTTRQRYEDLVRQMRAGGISNGSYYRSRAAPSPDDAEAEGS